MRELIKAEFFKLAIELNYKLLLLFSLVIGLIFGISSIQLGTTATGSVWYAIIGTGILYNAVLVSIFAADFIGSEFKDRTFSASVSCGILREKIVYAKSVVFFVAILSLILTYNLVCVFILTIQNGFGMEFNIQTITFLLYKTIYCILCNITLGSLIFLIAFMVKNKIQIIGLGIVGIYMLSQWNITARSPIILKILQFTFVYQLDAVISGRRAKQVPLWIVAVSSIIETAILLFAAVIVFQKSDLK